MKKFSFIFLFLFSTSLFAYQDPLTDVTSAEAFDNLYPKVSSFTVQENPKVARFFLVRHGENVGNATRMIDGRTLNLPLTNKGQEDALQAGKLLASKISTVDLVLSSPMLRTQQTAQGVLKAFDNPPQPILDARLLERFHGIFEGCPQEKELPYKDMIPVAFAHLPTFMEKFDFKEHPSMESYKEVYDRMSACLLEYAAQHLGENIIVSTHSGSIRSIFLMDLAEQQNAFVPNYLFKPTNGCILIVESDGKTLTVKAMQGIKFIKN